MDKAASMAFFREQAFQRRENPARFGRGGIEKNRLLDDSDNNLGNAIMSNPQPFPTTLLETNPPRIIALDALSPTAQTITIAIAARYVRSAPPPAVLGATFGGPIVCILEFGNGSTFTRVEVDVPLGRINLTQGGSDTASEPEDGVNIVTVPAGTLRVYARNDGNLIPSTIHGVASGAAQGLVTPAVDSIAGNQPRSVTVKAMAHYFTRPSVRLPTRTVFLYLNSVPGLFTLALTDPRGFYNIPPFAKTVRLIRKSAVAGTPPAPAAVIAFTSPFTVFASEAITIPLGTPSPIIDVPGTATWFSVSGGPFAFLAAEFGIGI